MFCPYCGKPIVNEDYFCRGCGKRLPDKYGNPVGQKTNNRPKKNYFLLVGGAVLLVVFVIIGITVKSKNQAITKFQIENNAYLTNESRENSPGETQQQVTQTPDNGAGISSHKEWIAITRNNHTLILVKPDGKQEKNIFESNTESISFLKWSPNGRYLSFGIDGSSRYDGSLMIWDMEEEKLTSVIKNWEGDVKWNTKSDDYLLVMIKLENNNPMMPPGQKLSLWNTNSQDILTITEELGGGYQWVDEGTRVLYDIDAKSSEGEFFCPDLPSWVSKDGIYSYEVANKENLEVVPEKKNPLGLQFASPDGNVISLVEFEPHCIGADDFCWPENNVYTVDIFQPGDWRSLPDYSCVWANNGNAFFCGDAPCNDVHPFIFYNSVGKELKNYKNEIREEFYYNKNFINKIWAKDNDKIVINAWLQESNTRKFYVFSLSGDQQYLDGIDGEAKDWAPNKNQLVVVQGEAGKEETIGIFDLETKKFVINLGPGTNAVWQPVGN